MAACLGLFRRVHTCCLFFFFFSSLYFLFQRAKRTHPFVQRERISRTASNSLRDPSPPLPLILNPAEAGRPLFNRFAQPPRNRYPSRKTERIIIQEIVAPPWNGQPSRERRHASLFPPFLFLPSTWTVVVVRKVSMIALAILLLSVPFLPASREWPSVTRDVIGRVSIFAPGFPWKLLSRVVTFFLSPFFFFF